jgi:hypothetical protein
LPLFTVAVDAFVAVSNYKFSFARGLSHRYVRRSLCDRHCRLQFSSTALFSVFPFSPICADEQRKDMILNLNKEWIRLNQIAIQRREQLL